jgi:phosphatidylserine/phosphatidylglycerophosphate/cardiolipin synthase-like enzyme
VRRAGGDRVAIYDLENGDGTPVYVHAKVCVIDDVWMIVGSDNLNRRSWTHDSEISCAVIDSVLDDREPLDPAGLGDGARRVARDARLRLWGEHLERAPDDRDDLVDPTEGFTAFARCAGELEAWHEAGQRGQRPPGHARPHDPEHVGAWAKWWAHVAHRLMLDPDGRPRELRGGDGL